MTTQELLRRYEQDCKQCKRDWLVPPSCNTCSIKESRERVEKKRKWK